jgi:hypothetical protein
MTGMLVLRRVLALVLATALLVAAVIGFVEIAMAALNRPPWIVPGEVWATWLRGHRWNDAVVRVGLSVVLGFGLLLLVAGVRRGRPAELALTSTEPGVTVTASRRSVERLLAAAARSIPGITSAQVSARRRGVRVNAWTRIRDAGDLRERVEAAVRESIDGLELSRRPRLKVRVRTEERR